MKRTSILKYMRTLTFGIKVITRTLAMLGVLTKIAYSEDEQPQTPKIDFSDASEPSESIQPATVNAIDGTRIEMLVSSDGKAVTVAAQDPQTILRNKRKKHPLLNGNPVDEPLSIGLINISSLTLIEDAQPEISNTLP